MAAREEGAVFVNAGYERVPAPLATEKTAWINDYQMHQMALWEVGRPDTPTFYLALEYLKAHRPRLLYIAFGETDDWAHARRYDRLLDALHIYDEYLRILWETLESMDGYRGRTTLVITTDHGRGIRPKDWVEHDAGIKGSEDIWVAVIGPDTPDRGEVAPSATVYQADVAATILRLLGLDPRAFDPAAGPPIAAAFGP
jgi:phosphopentomutase